MKSHQCCKSRCGLRFEHAGLFEQVDQLRGCAKRVQTVLVAVQCSTSACSRVGKARLRDFKEGARARSDAGRSTATGISNRFQHTRVRGKRAVLAAFCGRRALPANCAVLPTCGSACGRHCNSRTAMLAPLV